MKELKKYRVKSAYGVYRKGDIIQPTGMLRDELLMCGRIEEIPEPASAPVPVDDISDDEDDVLIETAVAPEPVVNTQRYGRRNRR